MPAKTDRWIRHCLSDRSAVGMASVGSTRFAVPLLVPAPRTEHFSIRTSSMEMDTKCTNVVAIEANVCERESLLGQGVKHTIARAPDSRQSRVRTVRPLKRHESIHSHTSLSSQAAAASLVVL
ncbi:hypothetical protein HIM_06518 [Hirsutella minnesotensis 3608]|uniref:Uncharacterized protein n=1 Tax=Hirsutella minnesotensis 3608 TaxID=1043627 RepID=A0A0F8A4S1_9HYPO|nr:hypothetical protein HIM_06518 [Hirsutella minnesotensis 3608]